MSKRGLIYYQDWLEEQSPLIWNSHKHFCEKLHISYEALLFACSLVGNDTVHTGYKNFYNAIKYTRSLWRRDDSPPTHFYRSQFKKHCNKPNAEELFNQFCESYVWQTAQSIPNDFFYTATDYNEEDYTFKVTSSYGVSKISHLLFSWIYKSPILLNPYSQQHGICSLSFAILVSSVYGRYTKQLMQLVDRHYTEFDDSPANPGVIILHIENGQDQERITSWAAERVSLLNNKIQLLSGEVLKSVEKMKLLRRLPNEEKLKELRKLVPEATSLDFLSTLLLYEYGLFMTVGYAGISSSEMQACH